jgi:trans-aconitate methyltransferase
MRWDAASYQARHSYVFKFGEGLVEMLDPKSGERIIDLGCGGGQLTARIAESGAQVIGIDASAEMIAQARENFPHLDFRIGDAATFEVTPVADAVFSNAVLHWVKDASAAIARIHAALAPGGRFVAELGGQGNTRTLLESLREVAGPVELPWFFPSVGEYSSLLERRGFEVRLGTLFDRPTPIEGESGLEDWLTMFGQPMFPGVAEGRRAEIRREVAARLRPKIFRDGAWWIDYRRLRVIAVKTSAPSPNRQAVDGSGTAAVPSS